MEKYIVPEMEIVKFETEDIITTSGEDVQSSMPVSETPGQ